MTKKQYAALQRKTNEGINEDIKKIKYCRKYGHKEDRNNSHIISGPSGTKVYAECPRCGLDYQRSLTSEEYQEFEKSVNAPIKILVIDQNLNKDKTKKTRNC